MLCEKCGREIMSTSCSCSIISDQKGDCRMKSSHEVATEIMDQFKIHESCLHPVDNNELFLEIVEILETSKEETIDGKKQLSKNSMEKVFDDPVFCDDGQSRCTNLNLTEWRCGKYTKDILVKHNTLRWFIKCDKCKIAYQKANQ